MGRPLRIGLYSPFFGSTIGGGEKYLGVTAETVRDAFPGAEVEILCPVTVDVARYEHMLGLDLHAIGLRSGNPRAGRLKTALARLPSLRLYRDLFVSAQAASATAGYDLLISMVYVLPAFNRARRGVILCQFPYELRPELCNGGQLRRLYRLPYRYVRRRLFGREIDDFELVICQSEYVRGWVRTLWKRESVVVNPPIDVPDGEPNFDAKGNLIVSVGRFFASGHSKRHDVMVQAFRELCDAGRDGWELHMAGSVHHRPVDIAYLERVRELARGYPVRLHTDATGDEVQDLYQRASIYWHAAGFGADAARRPAELEHFGMTTAEAMGHGTVPVAIGCGGQPEVVQDGVTGYLWQTPTELKSRTAELMDDPSLRRRMGAAARQASLRFSRAEFSRRMASVLRPLVVELAAEANR